MMDAKTRESLEFLVRLMKRAQYSRTIEREVVQRWVERLEAALAGREVLEQTW